MIEILKGICFIILFSFGILLYISSGVLAWEFFERLNKRKNRNK